MGREEGREGGRKVGREGGRGGREGGGREREVGEVKQLNNSLHHRS